MYSLLTTDSSTGEVREIPTGHSRALASAAALRSRMLCTLARIVSPMDMPGRYTGSGGITAHPIPMSSHTVVIGRP
jgi:hypothetical protein